MTIHLKSGSVETRLSQHEFDYVVLQERSGDYLCPTSQRQCPEAENSFMALAELARRHGAETVMLGTYQPLPDISDVLESSEARIAGKAKTTHIPVSERIRCGREHYPEAAWFHEDGMHPGPALTLLMTVAIHHEIFGAMPGRTGFKVHVSNTLGPCPDDECAEPIVKYSFNDIRQAMELLKENHQR